MLINYKRCDSQTSVRISNFKWEQLENEILFVNKRETILFLIENMDVLPSRYQDLYKNTGQLQEQQLERRKRLLNQQLEKRLQQYDFRRDLIEIVSRKSDFNKEFKYNLMLSEWMMSEPDDIDNFLLVPCPKGVRCTLAVDKNKVAKLYYKNGTKFMQFKTNLPAYTILG